MMQFIETSTEVMKEGKFNLRDWICSEMSLENGSPVLGLFWNCQKDTLNLNLNWLKNCQVNEITKRIILSFAQKIYDPIGIISPVTLFPKILLQTLWKDGSSWDSEVNEVVKKKFLNWYNELFILKEVSVPRWIHTDSDKRKALSIHTFCDASSHAVAAAVFVRVQTSAVAQVYLLASKSRVAPIKQVTIPRLELIAATVGARLCTSVAESLQWNDVDLHFWTDSSTVLTWIQREEIWSVFVKNRVEEIRRLTKVENWRHVSGKNNPADLPSRGCSAKQFLSSKWWEGPTWLRKHEKEWPVSSVVYSNEEITREMRKSVNTHLNIESTEMFDRISSYNKLVKIVSWIYRFYFNLRSKISRYSGDLTLKEINNAELMVLKLVQKEEFPDGVKDQKIKGLHPILDEKGLLRVETRIFTRQDKRNFRLPIVLPSKHRIVNMLVEHKHRKLGHAGVQILMNNLRERYWILQSRRTIRQILSSCIRCKRFTVKHPEPRSIYLPENRVKDAAIFEVIGVDLAGPLYLKDGTKAWIVLYTCAVFRAVHLELITSLTTEAFLQSFRRFIARRGRPCIVYSDNASNFVKAQKELGKVDWQKIERVSISEKISWKFIPPSAPWWGGWWERLIGIMKQILRRVLGQAILTYEELHTVLCDAENLINSRPLTYLSEDVNDLVALSPLMFLQEIKDSDVPDIDKVDATYMRKRYRYIQRIREDLRRRFRIEYLGQLKYTEKSKILSKPISVGEIVLIGTDNLKRLQWPIGRVLELLPGKDGVIRVVKLKTKFGIITRPVQRVYPLEISEGDDGPDMRNKIYQTKPNKKKSVPKVPDLAKDSPVMLKPTVTVTRSGRAVKPAERLNL